MSLGTTRFSAVAAAGSNAKNRDRDIPILVLMVVARLLSRGILNLSLATRTVNVSQPRRLHIARGRAKAMRLASSDAKMHCRRLTTALSGRSEQHEVRSAEAACSASAAVWRGADSPSRHASP